VLCGYVSAGTGAAQQHLLPALMRVYAMADAVVGLDVDRDSFDKFRYMSDYGKPTGTTPLSAWTAATQLHWVGRY
jgi:hypothetical protein